MDISDDTLFKSFVINRGLRERTIKRYKRQLESYCNFMNKTPSELIQQAENEEDQGLRMRNRSIKINLLGFKQHLEQQNYSSHTIVNTITIVRSFYTEFDIELPRIHLKQKHKTETIEDIPNKEDIKLALKYANIKYRAIILTMSSSGFGSAEVRSIKYHDFLNSLTEYIELPKNTYVPVDELIDKIEKIPKDIAIIPCWKLMRIKTEAPLITFSTPESVTAILEYIEIDPPLTLESPLFRSNKVKDKEITDGGLIKYFHKLNELCGFGKSHLQGKFISHSVGRKWFATTLNDVGIPQLTIDFFLAHSLGPVTSAYIKPNIKTLKEHYIKCIPALSMRETEVHDITADDKKEFLEIKKENARITDDNARMREELDQMREDMLKLLPAKK